MVELLAVSSTDPVVSFSVTYLFIYHSAFLQRFRVPALHFSQVISPAHGFFKLGERFFFVDVGV